MWTNRIPRLYLGSISITLKTMNTFRPRSSRKPLLEKLFSSPNGRGIMDTPFVFMLLGAALSLYTVISLFKGEMNVGRYGSENIIYYSKSPGFFILVIVIFIALGAGLFLWGKRIMRQHEE